ncbi:hypothetical protein K438DRAFT_1773039 [Mycena galopus ATCC 62051]|nr:hypothetical protein K438DRAFT_1773039 [Mycena galopus ATCC 62051]
MVGWSIAIEALWRPGDSLLLLAALLTGIWPPDTNLSTKVLNVLNLPAPGPDNAYIPLNPAFSSIPAVLDTRTNSPRHANPPKGWQSVFQPQVEHKSESAFCVPHAVNVLMVLRDFVLAAVAVLLSWLTLCARQNVNTFAVERHGDLQNALRLLIHYAALNAHLGMHPRGPPRRYVCQSCPISAAWRKADPHSRTPATRLNHARANRSSWHTEMRMEYKKAHADACSASHTSFDVRLWARAAREARGQVAGKRGVSGWEGGRSAAGGRTVAGKDYNGGEWIRSDMTIWDLGDWRYRRLFWKRFEFKVETITSVVQNGVYWFYSVSGDPEIGYFLQEDLDWTCASVSDIMSASGSGGVQRAPEVAKIVNIALMMSSADMGRARQAV